ncbi:asparaginase domain-containing protein [Acinetobacter larvae]|uniref:L-asparaginase N-terminal domain-containing protein n=1 Tax=Acinetobacter larvae TaxID=1789224 RepID=A0A1B2LW83_9GAMM|nr:asparaginase domain-containing protein [Acinetobacter larvae]AOA57210.1 hypothetical protein BFG52_01800 [Acinetobacter larvae]
MNTIALIYMGGTFGCVGTPLAPMPPQDFLPQLQHYAQAAWPIQCFAAANIKDSSACDAADWLELIVQIQHLQQQGIQHFVVIHGTDTLSYAAATLSQFLHRSCHVIFTGSQYPLLNPNGHGLAPDSDAKHNLQYSLETICNVPAGVYVAFDQQLFAGHSTRKQHRNANDAFTGTLIQQNTIDHLPSTAAWQINADHIKKAQQFQIMNWMIMPNRLDYLAQQLAGLKNNSPDCLILQAYGTGNLAVDHAAIAQLQQLKIAGCLNILSSQVPFGKMQQSYAISDWVQQSAIVIDDCQAPAELYAKSLRFYLQYPDCTARYQHWSHQTH